MSTAAVAADAATTNWATYDGAVPARFTFYAVFFPVLFALCLVLPATICYACLARGRVVPYSPPNAYGDLGTFSVCDLYTLFSFFSFLILICFAANHHQAIGMGIMCRFAPHYNGEICFPRKKRKKKEHMVLGSLGSFAIRLQSCVVLGCDIACLITQLTT